MQRRQRGGKAHQRGLAQVTLCSLLLGDKGCQTLLGDREKISSRDALPKEWTPSSSRDPRREPEPQESSQRTARTGEWAAWASLPAGLGAQFRGDSSAGLCVLRHRRHTGSWQHGTQWIRLSHNSGALSKAQSSCRASVSACEKAERVISPPHSLPETSGE